MTYFFTFGLMIYLRLQTEVYICTFVKATPSGCQDSFMKLNSINPDTYAQAQIRIGPCCVVSHFWLEIRLPWVTRFVMRLGFLSSHHVYEKLVSFATKFILRFVIFVLSLLT